MARIVIVDDDVEFAEDLSKSLQQAGYDVEVKNRIEGLIEDIVLNQPDLLILDVMFPDNPVAGFDLARQIRRTKAVKDLPIILLTGINQDFPMDFSSHDIDPVWMPVQDFMEKPVKIPVLLEKIDRLIQKH